nr:hypothetical protein [Gilliamella apicola]
MDIIIFLKNVKIKIMNIIDIIINNHFLKQLYPHGIHNVSIVYFSTDLDNYTLKIRTNVRPAIEVEKWGVWQKDYDVVEIELGSNLIKKIECLNWLNNKKEICNVDIQIKEKDFQLIKFDSKDKDWYLYIEILNSLLFQRCKVYIKEEEDYNPL